MQVGQQRRQADSPGVVGRQPHHARPGRLQCRLSLAVGGIGGGDPRPAVAQQPRRGRQAQPAIDDDRLRVWPRYQAHRQLRVVGQHGADADEDGVVVGAQLVGQP